MSGFAVIAMVVGALVVVALIVLALDLMRGDVGGGRHTLARARRVLVVASDPETRAEGERWAVERRREQPELDYVFVEAPEGEGLYRAVQDAIEREHPDAIVVVRHDEEDHWALHGTYGRLKEEQPLPIDVIYVTRAGA